MKYLKFPFADTISINLNNGKRNTIVECELASSEIEIYQSLSYRKLKDFTKPLVLIFENPSIQYFSMQNFAFPLIQVNVDSDTQLVKKISLTTKKANNAKFIQAYSSFSMTIFFPVNSVLLNQIIIDKTKIHTI
jgi:uncharacterized membrane protein (UPF0127 family)